MNNYKHEHFEKRIYLKINNTERITHRFDLQDHKKHLRHLNLDGRFKQHECK